MTLGRLTTLWLKFSHDWQRKLTFGTIGITTMAVGSFGSLWLFVQVLHVNAQLAYILQAVVAIEMNFILNHNITWRDRPTHSFGELWQRWLRFHATRVATVPFNWALFSVLTGIAHINYLIANAVCILAVTVFTWLTGDRFVFVSKSSTPKEIDEQSQR